MFNILNQDSVIVSTCFLFEDIQFKKNPWVLVKQSQGKGDNLDTVVR